jgi:hypothetical protein
MLISCPWVSSVCDLGNTRRLRIIAVQRPLPSKITKSTEILGWTDAVAGQIGHPPESGLDGTAGAPPLPAMPRVCSWCVNCPVIIKGAAPDTFLPGQRDAGDHRQGLHRCVLSPDCRLDHPSGSGIPYAVSTNDQRPTGTPAQAQARSSQPRAVGQANVGPILGRPPPQPDPPPPAASPDPTSHHPSEVQCNAGALRAVPR